MDKVLDSPPVWTAVMVGLAWAQVAVTGPVFKGVALSVLGGALVLAGLVLTGLAAREFRRAETTILPHAWPTEIITTGVFAYTRNPIYLADALIVLGVGLLLGAWSVVILVPVFVRLMTRRFIVPEEAKLAARFRDAFEAYRASVPRWIWGGRVPVGKSRASD